MHVFPLTISIRLFALSCAILASGLLAFASPALAGAKAAVILNSDDDSLSVVDGDTFGAVGKGLTLEALRRYGPRN